MYVDVINKLYNKLDLCPANLYKGLLVFEINKIQ